MDYMALRWLSVGVGSMPRIRFRKPVFEPYRIRAAYEVTATEPERIVTDEWEVY
jgi:hypothetical protein